MVGDPAVQFPPKWSVATDVTGTNAFTCSARGARKPADTSDLGTH